MSDARAEILRRISSALRDVPAGDEPDDTAVIRAYRRRGESGPAELVQRFAERVRDYKAAVHVVEQDALRSAIASTCATRGAHRLVAPPDLPDAWTPEGVELVRDVGLSNQELDQVDGVLTACAVAVAQTGTIVLDGGTGQGRRAISLVPDYHLCIVHADQIVELVPEAIERLEPAVKASRRPITFISGPSATSDIELNRVEGVHGPRTLEVFIVVPDGDAERPHV